MVPRFIEAHFEFSGRYWTSVCATYVFMYITSSWESIWWGMGNKGKKNNNNNNKDRDKEKLKLIVTEDKQGLVWHLSKSRPKILLLTEINYLENNNGHSWVQLRWTVCNRGGGVRVGFIYGSKTLGDDSKQYWVCHS